MRIFLACTNPHVTARVFEKFKEGGYSSEKVSLLTEGCSEKAFAKVISDIANNPGLITEAIEELIKKPATNKLEFTRAFFKGTYNGVTAREQTAKEMSMIISATDVFSLTPEARVYKDKHITNPQEVEDELKEHQGHFMVINDAMRVVHHHATTADIHVVNGGWLDFYLQACVVTDYRDYFQVYLNEALPHTNHPEDVHILLQMPGEDIDLEKVTNTLGLYTDNIIKIKVPDDYFEKVYAVISQDAAISLAVKGIENRTIQIKLDNARSEIY